MKKLTLVFSIVFISLILNITGCATYSVRRVWDPKGSREETQVELNKCYQDALIVPVHYSAAAVSALDAYVYRCMTKKGYTSNLQRFED